MIRFMRRMKRPCEMIKTEVFAHGHIATDTHGAALDSGDLLWMLLEIRRLEMSPKTLEKMCLFVTH
jgi:hypothetical protein